MIYQRRQRAEGNVRERILLAGVVFVAAVVGIRLVQLQIANASFYRSLAQGQREIFSKLLPERGEILVHDKGTDKLYPVATNREVWTIYLDTRQVTDAKAGAKALAPLLIDYADVTDEKVKKQMLADKEAELEKHFSTPNDPYDPLFHGADDELADTVRALAIPGVNLATEKVRYYSDKDFGGQVLGFVGYKGNEKVGRYGVEGYWDKELAGIQGYLSSERDPSGQVIAVANQKFREKQDGADIVLTVDRTLQAFSCSKLRDWVHQHGADSGSVVMLDVKSGAVMVMCGAPDFDPNAFGKEKDAAVFNNRSIFTPYEPGSVIKTMTMAAAMDAGKITPTTTYDDKGVEHIADKDIKNSDGVAHGIQTMTQVLDESLNTGAIFAMRSIGPTALRQYFESFGFGKLTGIELDTESPGNTAPLQKKSELYAATASFGQGFTATVLQLAVAYAAIANEGKLMKPYIVDAIQEADGTVIKTSPHTVAQVISARAATLVSGMLVSVVENGHGKKAKVPGYYIAGKTGTAQVPRLDGPGYEPADVTIGTFAGFAPASNPRFALVVRIDHPRDVQFAESSAAPLFGQIASFALQYLEVPPDQPN